MDRSELKERNKVSREMLGKHFYDLSKLVFAGTVVGGFNPFSGAESPNWILVMNGVLFTIILSSVGYRIVK